MASTHLIHYSLTDIFSFIPNIACTVITSRNDGLTSAQPLSQTNTDKDPLILQHCCLAHSHLQMINRQQCAVLPGPHRFIMQFWNVPWKNVYEADKPRVWRRQWRPYLLINVGDGLVAAKRALTRYHCRSAFLWAYDSPLKLVSARGAKRGRVVVWRQYVSVDNLRN